jgi:GNAT superfamily N-acetyltransferase
MIVRPAEPRDADAVLALMEGLTRPAVAEDPQPQREVLLTHLGHNDALVYVAEVEGIPDLYVEPAFRRRGVARTLLEACVTEARRRGCATRPRFHGDAKASAVKHQLYEAYDYARAYALAL